MVLSVRQVKRIIRSFLISAIEEGEYIGMKKEKKDFKTNCEYSRLLDDIDEIIEEAKEIREELIADGEDPDGYSQKVVDTTRFRFMV